MENLKELQAKANYYKEVSEKLEAEFWDLEDEYHEEVQALSTMIEGQDQIIRELKEENIEQGALIFDLKVSNNKMDDTIDQMGELITSQSQTIKAQDQTIKELKADIEEYNQMIDDLLQEVARLKGWTK